MMEHYPAFIVIVPFLFAFVVSGETWIKKELCFP